MSGTSTSRSTSQKNPVRSKVKLPAQIVKDNEEIVGVGGRTRSKAGTADSAESASTDVHPPKVKGQPQTGEDSSKKKTPKVPVKKELKDQENIFEVESIRGVKFEGPDCYFLVKWKGYEENENTWESIKNVEGCKDLVNKFLKKLQQQNVF